MLEQQDRHHILYNRLLSVLAPPPKLTVSQWADQYRILSGPGVSEPGPWNTSRAEFQRGIMDAVNDPLIETVVLMMSTQVGKTETLLNILGYYLSMDPGPILAVMPTEDTARGWSKDRLNPLLNCPIFQEKKAIEEEKGEDKSTILQKRINGATLTVAFSSSAAQLASRPIRILLCDEVDRYLSDAGGEGDPVKLAVKRTSTFWNRKIILASSPGRKGASRIASAYEGSDQRKFFVPLRCCGEFQTLTWSQVKWKNKDPQTAVYECLRCRQELFNQELKRSLPQGKWRMTGTPGTTAGFHLSELYSPWKGLHQMVADFLECKKNPHLLKTFINTSLAEVWHEKGTEIDPGPLMARREDYTVLPLEALVVVCGVDVQRTHRLVGEVVAYGENYQSWGVEYFEILGDPTTEAPWAALKEKLNQKYRHALGIDLEIVCATVDSGHLPEMVYKFCQGQEYRRIFPIKGMGTQGGPVLGKKSWRPSGVWLFPVGTDTCKSMIYSWLQLNEPGPGYMHFPLSYTEEYFKELTAEEIKTRYVRGFEKREWVKKRRNEALDCRVYSLAALHLLNPDYEQIKKKFWQIQEREIPLPARPMELVKNEAPPSEPKARPNMGFENFLRNFKF